MKKHIIKIIKAVICFIVEEEHMLLTLGRLMIINSIILLLADEWLWLNELTHSTHDIMEFLGILFGIFLQFKIKNVEVELVEECEV